MINSQFQKTVLDNGIRVVTEKMANVRSVSMGVWVRAGSRDENSKNNGISHFLEHMLFKGTKKRSAKEIAQCLESSGGSLNAYTGKEVSCYTAFVLDKQVALAIDVLADILIHSVFAKPEIEKEKEVVLSEINHYLESPDEMVVEYLYQQLFPDHPLGFFIHGNPDNVARFSRTDLTDFLKENYTTDRTVFAAAGNVDHQQIIRLVQDKLVLPTEINQKHQLPLKYPARELLSFESNTSHQAHICLGARTFPFSDSRKYALMALEILMGGGMSSRLFQNIREKHGFAYSVYAFTDFMLDTGIIGFYLACSQDKIEKSLHLLFQEIKKIRKNSIKPEELEQTKSQMIGGFLLSLESSSRRMRRIGELETYSAEHLTQDEIVKKINDIKAKDLLDLANEFLGDKSLATTILKPENSS